MTIDVIILVGGQGTRLRSVVSDVPKPLAPVRGRPFLEYLLDQLESSAQVGRVVLAVGYKGDVVEEWCKGLSDRYSFEIVLSWENIPMGTGGAMLQAMDLVSTSDCLVMNGDSFLEFELKDLIAAHRDANEAMTMVLTQVEDTSRYGMVHYSLDTKRVLSMLEKDSAVGVGLVNAGVYVVRRDAVSMFEKSAPCSFEKEMMPQLISQGTSGYVTHGAFIDIGTEASFLRAQEVLKGFC